MLDFDLAELYEVETRILNQAVKRNNDIFPQDFMFKLTEKEWEDMSSHFVMTYPVKRPKSALPLGTKLATDAQIKYLNNFHKLLLTSFAIKDPSFVIKLRIFASAPLAFH